MCTMSTCSGFKILMNGELTALPLSNILCQQRFEAMVSTVSTEQLRISKCT